MDIVDKKNHEREKGLTARKSLDKIQVEKLSKIITRKLTKQKAYLNAKTILTYMPYAGEVDTTYFNEQALKDGKVLAYPICYKDGVMKAAIPNTNTGLAKGKYGIPAPKEDDSTIVNPSDIHLVIVPCIAFCGSNRMRTGWGAGYYDRYLSQHLNAKTIAAAYELQHIENLCFDSWDVPLDMIITESEIYK